MSDPLDLENLDRLAAAATPGPWEWDPEGFMGCGQVWTLGPGVEGGSIAGPTGDCYPRSGYSPKEDMQFIAAASPSVVAELVRRVREAEAEVLHEKRRLADVESGWRGKLTAAEARVAKLERQLLIATESGNAEAGEHEALRAEVRRLTEERDILIRDNATAGVLNYITEKQRSESEATQYIHELQAELHALRDRIEALAAGWDYAAAFTGDPPVIGKYVAESLRVLLDGNNQDSTSTLPDLTTHTSTI